MGEVLNLPHDHITIVILVVQNSLQLMSIRPINVNLFFWKQSKDDHQCAGREGSEGFRNATGHLRSLSSSTEDGSPSEIPCETEETAPLWEQNRNILSFSESLRTVEVL